MSLDRLTYMFSKISSIRESEFDEKTVIFLKNYILNTMKNFKYTKRNDPKSGMTMTNLFRGSKKDSKVDDK